MPSKSNSFRIVHFCFLLTFVSLALGTSSGRNNNPGRPLNQRPNGQVEQPPQGRDFSTSPRGSGQLSSGPDEDNGQPNMRPQFPSAKNSQRDAQNRGNAEVVQGDGNVDDINSGAGDDQRTDGPNQSQNGDSDGSGDTNAVNHNSPSTAKPTRRTSRLTTKRLTTSRKSTARTTTDNSGNDQTPNDGAESTNTNDANNSNNGDSDVTNDENPAAPLEQVTKSSTRLQRASTSDKVATTVKPTVTNGETDDQDNSDDQGPSSSPNPNDPYEPKMPIEAANKAFLYCCQKSLPAACNTYCKYNVSLTELAAGFWPTNGGICGFVNLGKYYWCATDGEDSTDCCKAKGILGKDSVCKPFCKGGQHMEQLGIQHMECGNHLTEFMKCHWAHRNT